MRRTPSAPKNTSQWVDETSYQAVKDAAFSASNVVFVGKEQSTLAMNKALDTDVLMIAHDIIKGKIKGITSLPLERAKAAFDGGSLYDALKQAAKGGRTEHERLYARFMELPEAKVSEPEKKVFEAAVKAGLDKAQEMLKETLRTRGTGAAAALG